MSLLPGCIPFHLLQFHLTIQQQTKNNQTSFHEFNAMSEMIGLIWFLWTNGAATTTPSLPSINHHFCWLSDEREMRVGLLRSAHNCCAIAFLFLS